MVNSFRRYGLIPFLFLLFCQQSPAQLFRHYHLSADTCLSGPQNIHIIEVPWENLEKHLQLGMAFSDSALYPTSKFASDSLALVGINGGFFHVKEGGSVTYLEYAGKKVAHRSFRGDSLLAANGNFNGALVCYKGGRLQIEKAQSSADYLLSEAEEWVFTAGPLLILNGQKQDLLDRSFVTDKHPRSCLAFTPDALLLITLDGRHEQAAGAALPELQNFLLSRGVKDALNLDGGGSTTLYLNDGDRQAVVNCPSDNKSFDSLGERSVANILFLRKLK